MTAFNRREAWTRVYEFAENCAQERIAGTVQKYTGRRKIMDAVWGSYRQNCKREEKDKKYTCLGEARGEKRG
jgi:hypothetical protein